MINDLVYKVYEDYKSLIAGNGTSMYEFSTEFKDFFELLHNVPELELEEEKEDIQKAIYDFVFFRMYQLSPTDNKKMLLRLKNSMKKLQRVVDEVLDAELKACEIVESADERFINSFSDSHKQDKKSTAEMCGFGTTWINNHKKEFHQEENGGVYIKDFLKWLVDYDNKAFQNFRKKYQFKSKNPVN